MQLKGRALNAVWIITIKAKWGSSPAHKAFKEVVFDKNIVKDIQQLTLCCHTGSLEVYHSVQTKYVPKREHVLH